MRSFARSFNLCSLESGESPAFAALCVTHEVVTNAAKRCGSIADNAGSGTARNGIGERNVVRDKLKGETDFFF
jgi:hypothetical protein